MVINNKNKALKNIAKTQQHHSEKAYEPYW